MPKRVSVIVATLGRPSYQNLLASLQAQTLPKESWELLAWYRDPVNEYAARNKAAAVAKGDLLCFLDDDTTVPKDYLEKGLRIFDKDPELVMVDGCLEGDFFGWGRTIRLDQKHWGIGATLWFRKEPFLAMGGFQVDWSLGKTVKGWRGDTGILYEVLERYGERAHYHSPDMTVYHPTAGGSSWQPEVEARFYELYQKYILSYITPYDPRICQFVVGNRLERDPLVLDYLTSDQKARADFARMNCPPPILDVGAKDGWTFHGTVLEHVNLDVDRFRLSVQADGFHIPFTDRSFESVYLGEIIEHVQDPVPLLLEALRVARSRAVFTVPAEHEWAADKAPMLTREQRLEKDGFSDVDAMQQHFTGAARGLVQVLPESQLQHTWHVSWFTDESLLKLIESVPIAGAQVFKIQQGGFVWFAGVLEKLRPSQ